MSVTSCVLLLVIFPCLPVCDSRHLRLDEKERAKRFTASSIKIAGIMGSNESNINVISKVKQSPRENGLTAADRAYRKSTLSDVKTEELDAAEATKKIISDSKRKVVSTHHAQDGSLVSVSWHLPRKKPSEKHLGFNSDYSPPKTHPPSHN